MNRTAKEIIGSSQVNTNAINAHLITLGSLEDALNEFNGKVVNVRLFNSLTTAAGQPVRVNKSYDNATTYIEFRYDKVISLEGSAFYADWHRECRVPITFRECGKRLDAEATILNIDTLIHNLHKQLRNFNISELNIISVHTELDELKKQVSALIDAQSNPFLKESLRDSLKYIR